MRPSPWHVTHRSSTMRPSPRQRGHADTLTICPSIVWRTDRTSPRPLHCGHVVGDVPAGPRCRCRSRTVEHPEVDLLLGPGDRLLERDPQVVPQVRSRLRPPAPCRGGRRTAEERVEDVAEATEPGGAEPEVPFATAPDSRPAEHVVALAAVRVGQHLVGLVDLLEALLRRGVRVDVGVPLLGELAERSLDLGIGGAPFHAEDGVVVEFGGHSTVKDTRGRPRTRSGPGSLRNRTVGNIIPSPPIPFRIPKSDVWVGSRILSRPISDRSARLVRQPRARRSTVSSIGGVSTPVNVFCWLGWYVPRSRYGPTATSAPCPKRGFGRTTCPSRRAPKPGIPRVRAERHDHADPGQQPELQREPRCTRVALLDRRLVGGRRAAHRGSDVGVEERSPSSGRRLTGRSANPTACSAAKRKSPEASPVKTRPVRLPPCAAGASPSSRMRASGSPKPGTGRAQ